MSADCTIESSPLSGLGHYNPGAVWAGTPFHLGGFMIRGTRFVRVALCLVAGAIACCAEKAAAQTGDGSWKFAVSGDSRNCGDVVMPGIAASALKHKPE